jgi:twitching motility protein PilT
MVATEILIGTDAVLNLIREGKFHQLASTMQSSGQVGMHTLASDLANLLRQGYVTQETALAAVNDKNELEQYLGVW